LIVKFSVVLVDGGFFNPLIVMMMRVGVMVVDDELIFVRVMVFD
jgi:hypothetical protein